MSFTFQIGGVPVRVLPSFFLMAALLGMANGDPMRLVAWLGVVFFSVLVHELGHATVGRLFGLEPNIVLHGTGGTTSWTGARALPPPKRIAISLAGPGAGFLLAALVRVVVMLRPGAIPSGVAGYVVGELYDVNLGWGVLNLVPMLPLDGGSVMAQVLAIVSKQHAQRIAYIVSIVVAAVALAIAGLARAVWPAILAVSFLASNWRALGDLSAAEREAPLRAELEEAYRALQAKDGARVLELARPVALRATSAPTRAEAMQLVAFGFLLEGRLADADAALAAMPEGFAPHESLLALRSEVARGGPS